TGSHRSPPRGAHRPLEHPDAIRSREEISAAPERQTARNAPKYAEDSVEKGAPVGRGPNALGLLPFFELGDGIARRFADRTVLAELARLLQVREGRLLVLRAKVHPEIVVCGREALVHGEGPIVVGLGTGRVALLVATDAAPRVELRRRAPLDRAIQRRDALRRRLEPPEPVRHRGEELRIVGLARLLQLFEGEVALAAGGE